MKTKLELLGPHHLEQPVLIRTSDGEWININAYILSIYNEGQSVAVVCEPNGVTDTLVMDREDVKLKF